MVTERSKNRYGRRGIMNENTRKLMSKDDSADKTVVADKTLVNVFEDRVKIKLGQILNDHGLYAPFGMKGNIRYILFLPKADEIMVAQSGQKVAGYSLEDIRLEYSTIKNSNIYNQALNEYEGRSLIFRDISFVDAVPWGKDTVLINKTINSPCESMGYIVKNTLTDSEEYVFPNIKRVDVTIEGIPNSIYSQGLGLSRLFSEAREVFLNHETDTLSITDFFSKDKFALVIDLRTFPDNLVSGNGRKVSNSKSGICLSIRKDKTSEDLMSYKFVVADGHIQYVNKAFQKLVT